MNTLILFVRTSAFLFCLLFSISGYSQAADSGLDVEAIKKFAESVDDEFSYRQRIETEAATWAEELMFMYKWSAKYPTDWHGGRDRTLDKGDVSKRLHSEFAWLSVTGFGAVATFDFFHAETTFIGSTSRFVSTLLLSKNFWIEIRKQCLEIREFKKNAPGSELKSCADRIRRDLTISQLVGSNVSLFVGGGVAIGLGKRLFQRYASKWVAARVLPLLPAAARSKWVMGGLTAAVVVIPAGFIMASVSDQQKEDEAYLEGLPDALKANQEQEEKTSILNSKALRTEREVFEFVAWINSRTPKPINGIIDEQASQRFLFDMKMSAPNYAVLLGKRSELDTRRQALEAELAVIPDVSQKLRSLAERRKHGDLKPDEAKLLRKAQYLSALRLATKLL